MRFCQENLARAGAARSVRLGGWSDKRNCAVDGLTANCAPKKLEETLKSRQWQGIFGIIFYIILIFLRCIFVATEFFNGR